MANFFRFNTGHLLILSASILPYDRLGSRLSSFSCLGARALRQQPLASVVGDSVPRVLARKVSKRRLKSDAAGGVRMLFHSDSRSSWIVSNRKEILQQKIASM